MEANATRSKIQAYADANPSCCVSHLMERFNPSDEDFDFVYGLRADCSYDCDGEDGCPYNC